MGSQQLLTNLMIVPKKFAPVTGAWKLEKMLANSE